MPSKFFEPIFFIILQRLAWTVAALVIVINGYLLLDFFFSEVKGLLFGSLVCAATAAYVAFIIYLVTRSGELSPTWRSLEMSKRVTCAGN